MQNSPKISVIVPVYKSEPYLDHCVESIVNQTYTNLEIILIDDGSPDKCPVMCDTWAQKDSRVKVIHQKNAGGGPARNAGLDAATGEIIAFVDSDDYLAPQMYEYLYGLMDDEIDIAECCIQLTENDAADFSFESIPEVRTCSTEEALYLHICDTMFRQTPPNKLYRRNTTEGVRFPAGTKIDDEFFTYRLLGNARKLVHSELPLYAYRQQSASLMHSMGARRRAEALEAKIQRNSYLQEHFPSLVGESLKNLWFTALYQGQMALRELPPSQVQEALDYITNLLKPCHLSREHFTRYSTKEKLWIHLAQDAFVLTCRLRNWLKIGL